jgi:hypothetical protein
MWIYGPLARCRCCHAIAITKEGFCSSHAPRDRFGLLDPRPTTLRGEMADAVKKFDEVLKAAS